VLAAIPMRLALWAFVLMAAWQTCGAFTSLPRHLAQRGMSLTIDDQNAPVADGNTGRWFPARGSEEAATRDCDKITTIAPQVHFLLSLEGEEICTATVAGYDGFPEKYAEALMDVERPPMRTLKLANLRTAKAYRRQGCATAMMDVVEEWLRSKYSPEEVEIMYLEDFSQLLGFYASRGWSSRVPGAEKTLLTKPLHPNKVPRVDLEAVEGLSLRDPIVSIGAISPIVGVVCALGLAVAVNAGFETFVPEVPVDLDFDW
jgi:GNAT superfamily N-acetyltransferase